VLRKALLATLAVFALGFLVVPTAHADPATWNDVVDEMNQILETAYTTYQAGDLNQAKQHVDDAYYGYYEKLGFEKVVMAHISGAQASKAEYEFALIKQGIAAGGPDADIRTHIDTLQGLLRGQANQLDGAQSNPWATFAAALLIILREGFEAILVVGAVIAYLVKSQNQDKLRPVYAGVVLALVASVLLAVAINAITALGGANQEIIEGATVLVAVVMLVWVSNWIMSKSDAEAWATYIKAKTDASVSRGSTFSLAFVAFLAVFREGAETILLFKALQAGGSDGTMIWLGLGIGLVLLVGVYLAIRYLSIKIPLRPFFLATSVLLAILALTFAGSGIKELQEGDVIPVTPLSGVPTVDLLGIYPTAQTLGCQAVVLALMATLLIASYRKARAARPAPSHQLETTS
jgi:high-affinity iron transporter